MQRIFSSGLKPYKRSLASFTLIELLTVITIIAILAALTLIAAQTVLNSAARSRAKAEVQTIGTALDSYKTDNAIYPLASFLTTNSYGSSDGSVNGGLYEQSSEALYQALSGQTNYTTAPAAGIKSYFSFKKNQIGNAAGPSYVQDPWSYSYGYSTGNPSTPPTTNDPTPYNGAGFFDLWSTGGLVQPQATNVNTWISNWK